MYTIEDMSPGSLVQINKCLLNSAISIYLDFTRRQLPGKTCFQPTQQIYPAWMLDPPNILSKTKIYNYFFFFGGKIYNLSIKVLVAGIALMSFRLL